MLSGLQLRMLRTPFVLRASKTAQALSSSAATVVCCRFRPQRATRQVEGLFLGFKPAFARQISWRAPLFRLQTSTPVRRFSRIPTKKQRSNPENEESSSLTDKFKTLVKKYGPVVLVVHTFNYATVFSVMYVFVESGHVGDVKQFLIWLMQFMPGFLQGDWITGRGGSLALALVCTKLVGPLRLVATIALSRWIAPRLAANPRFAKLLRLPPAKF